jgi:hypothetical protein
MPTDEHTEAAATFARGEMLLAVRRVLRWYKRWGLSRADVLAAVDEVYDRAD